MASLWNGATSLPQTASTAINKLFLQTMEDVQEHYVLSGLWVVAVGWLAKNSYDKRLHQGELDRRDQQIHRDEDLLHQLGGEARRAQRDARHARLARDESFRLVREAQAENGQLREDAAQAQRERDFHQEAATQDQQRRLQAQQGRDQAYRLWRTYQLETDERIRLLNERVLETSGLLADVETQLGATTEDNDRLRRELGGQLADIQDEYSRLRAEHANAIADRDEARSEAHRLGLGVSELRGEQRLSLWSRVTGYVPQLPHASEEG